MPNRNHDDHLDAEELLISALTELADTDDPQMTDALLDVARAAADVIDQRASQDDDELPEPEPPSAEPQQGTKPRWRPLFTEPPRERAKPVPRPEPPSWSLPMPRSRRQSRVVVQHQPARLPRDRADVRPTSLRVEAGRGQGELSQHGRSQRGHSHAVDSPPARSLPPRPRSSAPHTNDSPAERSPRPSPPLQVEEIRSELAKAMGHLGTEPVAPTERDEIASAPAPTRRPAHRPSQTGADLKAWRQGEGLTQQEAAARLGVAQGTISKAESRGGRALGESMRRVLADALGSAEYSGSPTAGKRLNPLE